MFKKKLVAICENCGRHILRHEDGTLDKHYKCSYKGSTLILCGDCVEDIADDYYKSWGGGFA